MTNGNDVGDDGKFEEYLREFQPSRGTAALRRCVLELAVRHRQRHIRAALWICSAAAVALLCFGAIWWLRPHEAPPVTRTTTEYPPARKVPDMRIADLVSHGTLLAAVARNGDSVERLLDEASVRIIAALERSTDTGERAGSGRSILRE